MEKRSENMTKLIELKGINKTYKNGDQELRVLKDIDLEVEEGEFVAIMGPSGSGKSTLMNVIGLLDRPTSGEYFLEGQEVGNLSEKKLARVRNEQIGFVFQQFFLLSKLNAFQNVELPLIYAGVHTGIGVGGTIFSPIITTLLEYYGWRHTYQIMALIILVLAFPAAFFLLRKSPQDMGLLPYGSEEPAQSKTSAAQSSFSFSLSVKESWSKVFFWIFIFGMLCNGLINTGALGHFPPAIEEMHGPQVQALIISMYSLIGILGKIVLGWLNDRYGVVVSTAFGCITFAVSFIFMLMGSNVMMLYIMAVLFGLGDAIGTVTPPLVTSAIFGTEKYGEAYGIANSFTQIGLSLGSLLVAAIYDASGSYNIAWILLLFLTVGALLGWIGSYFLSKKYRIHN